MGVTNSLPIRHQEHTRVWGAFDLARSALVRARSRRDVLDLETHLRHLYGDCSGEDRARNRGRVLTSAEFIALGSWRRYPGRCDKGYTEFYAGEVQELMLTSVQEWLATRGRRAAGISLQRGISPDECATRTRLANPHLTRAESRELREGRRAAVRQWEARMRAGSDRLMAPVFAFALAYQEHLIGVDLRTWREARATRGSVRGKDLLACLYFRPLEDKLHRDDPRVQAWLNAQWDLQEKFAPVMALRKAMIAEGCGPRNLAHGLGEGAGTQAGGDDYTAHHLPPPAPVEVTQVRVGNCYADPYSPWYERYEELARQTERHRVWNQQPDLRWGWSDCVALRMGGIATFLGAGLPART